MKSWLQDPALPLMVGCGTCPSFPGLLHEEGVEEMSSEVPASSDYRLLRGSGHPGAGSVLCHVRAAMCPNGSCRPGCQVCVCVHSSLQVWMEWSGELWCGYKVCVYRCVCAFSCMFSGGWAVCVYVCARGCMCVHIGGMGRWGVHGCSVCVGVQIRCV